MMKSKGIIAINKSQNWTSFDVVNKIKHLLHIRQVGHLGTLDPMATGVLLVTIGKATKLFDIMQEKTKTYIAEFEFGYSTDTLDSTGKVIDSTNIIPTKEDIEAILTNFIGLIDQIPPKYSAKCINGEKAYNLAREGKDFELKPKQVKIDEINLMSYNNKTLKLEIKCGSGTYIRSIGRDIAKELNSLATMTSLVRTQVGDITIDQSVKVEDLSHDQVDEFIVKIRDILKYPVINFNDEETRRILNGQTLVVDKIDGNYLLNDDFDTVAIIKVDNNKAKMSLFLA